MKDSKYIHMHTRVYARYFVHTYILNTIKTTGFLIPTLVLHDSNYYQTSDLIYATAHVMYKLYLH